VYQSAWLRRYHFSEFFTALFNNQPMGFWNPAVLTGDARRRGIEVRPVHLERSQAECVVEENHIRLGFAYVKGFGEAAIERLLQARDQHPFGDLVDLARRTRLSRRLLEQLVLAGACDHWGTPRRQLVWRLGKLRYAEETLPLQDKVQVDLPALSEAEAGGLEAQAVGLSTGRHVMAQLRPSLSPDILDAARIEHAPAGRRVTVAGLLVVRQQPYTAKGFVFLTLEDEFGLLNIVLRPKIAARYRRLLRTSSLITVSGIVERQGAVVNVVAVHLRQMDTTGNGANRPS
jgi:error-prone DNA polymerase